MTSFLSALESRMTAGRFKANFRVLRQEHELEIWIISGMPPTGPTPFLDSSKVQ